MTPELIVCGSLTLDNVVTADGTLLPRSAGGNVVYAALGAALWGHRVGLVSRAGSDFPVEFLDMLAERGLDLGGIARLDAAHGMNVAFAYRPDGSRVRAFPAELVARLPEEERPRFIDYTTLGAAHRYATWQGFAPDAGDIPPRWLVPGVYAHLAAMPVQRHMSLSAALHVTGHVQVDSPWYDERMPEQDFHTKLAPHVDLLLPSEADLAVWRPGLQPMQAATGLARATRRRVLVKCGAAGCVLLDARGEQILSVPAYPVEAIDPTGAGDSFCGGFLAGLRRHGTIRQAAIAGAAVASFTVQAAGIFGLLRATQDELHRRVDWIDAHTTPSRDTEPGQ
jgi:sugar/nucleoside kinase (ribokinase family)